MYVQCEGVCVEPKHFDRGDMVQKRWSTGINQAGIIKHEVYNEENASSKKKSSRGLAIDTMSFHASL